MNTSYRFLLALITLIFIERNALQAAVETVTVSVPKTAYIQWLTNSTDPMTNVNGNNTASFSAYVGGAATQLTKPSNLDTYIGVMCNSLLGYNINLTASNSGATTTTGNLTISGGPNLTYTGALSKVTSTFTAGTTAATALNLTGVSVSGNTTHTALADLPLTAAAPNVWKLTLSLPTISGVSSGLIMAGTYSGGVTATVSLK